MRKLGAVGPALLVVAAAASPAFARSHHGDSGVEVRDHRHSDSGSDTHVRDHRNGSDDSHVHVHVRDHRDRGSSGSVDYVTTDDVIVDDGAPASDFAHAPPFTLEVGGVARRFRGPGFTRYGTFDSTDPYMLSSGRASDADTAAGALAIRATVPVSDALYAGAEVEVGGLVRSPIRLMTDAPDLHISSQTMIGSAAIVGARARQGVFELDGEVAGGVRLVSTTIQAYDATEDDPSSAEIVPSLLLEARARGAVWLSPHLFLGGQVGVGIVDRSDVQVGLSIGFSSKAFGLAR